MLFSCILYLFDSWLTVQTAPSGDVDGKSTFWEFSVFKGVSFLLFGTVGGMKPLKVCFIVPCILEHRYLSPFSSMNNQHSGSFLNHDISNID